MTYTTTYREELKKLIDRTDDNMRKKQLQRELNTLPVNHSKYNRKPTSEKRQKGTGLIRVVHENYTWEPRLKFINKP